MHKNGGSFTSGPKFDTMSFSAASV